MLRLLVAVALSGAVAVACSSAPPPAVPESFSPGRYSGDLPLDPVAVPVGSMPEPSFATATPHPTFTPLPPRPQAVYTLPFPTREPALAAPTAEPDLGPTLVPHIELATPTPQPTLLPQPTLVGIDTADLFATPTPSPLQYYVPDSDLLLKRQTVFMSYYAEPPSFWPRPSAVFYTRTARHIGWWVEFDYADASEDFEMRGLLRLLNVTNGEHVIYQTPYDLTYGRDLFIMLGDDVPGTLWFPGLYRFEAWDNRDRVAVHYDFEVRSGMAY